MPSTQSPSPRTVPEPSQTRLAMNLASVAMGCPQTAERISKAPPADEAIFLPTDDEDAPAITMDGVALCSRRRPVDEGRRFAEAIDLKASGMIVVLGFGAGHHVRALVERVRGRAVIVIYEPDESLLRSVFERIDCRAWLARPDVILLTRHEGLGEVSRALSGHEALLAIGTAIVEHMPSRQRLAGTAPKFVRLLTEYVGTVRMHMVTTLVQSDVSVRNMLMNLDHYAEHPGIADLAGAATGRPAVVVSAGPSLRRNLRLLAEPGVRDRVVIIAAQTVLKPMLNAGVRPHFVTALDYHEISRRFYEGLTAEDVRGVTLVAEAKVNPAVLEAWPGAMRLPADDFLGTMLGPELAGDRGGIRAGATVAHLSYYLARYMACDPVVLIGQDLGFTDGQYYAAGAAIHDVWAGELNAFNTLEMMEWQRIVRNRGHLHKVEDHLGREIYTDDQMRTYLSQFERDFMDDTRRGLRVVDATEGGVRKAHAETMTLREALDRLAPAGAPRIDLPVPEPTPDPARRDAVLARVRETRIGVTRIAAISRETSRLLTRMKELTDDQPALNKLIDRAHKMRDEVKTIEPAWTLMHRVNQAGAFNRIRADRAIASEDGLTPAQEQRRRIDRDLTNVRWIAEASDVLEDLLGATEAVFAGGPRRTRDLSPRETESGSVEIGAVSVRAGAFVIADHGPTLSAVPEAPERIVAGEPALTRTLRRLARCRRLESIRILSTDPARTLPLVPAELAERVQVAPFDNTASTGRRASIRAARAWAGPCWRGGLGFTTCYDEVLDPHAIHESIEQSDLEAALIVGADWCFVDPAICDAVLERHAENPEAHALAFTQAPPGLAGCVIARPLLAEMAGAVQAGAMMSHLGGALGYIPRAPRNDPIARSNCVGIDSSIRDTPFRFIPDSPESARVLELALAEIPGPDAISAADLCARIRSVMETGTPAHPEEITLEITTERAGDSPVASARVMPTERAVELLRRLGQSAPGTLLTLGGAGDPLCHPDWRTIVDAALDAGFGAVHVRTELRGPVSDAQTLASSGVAIISVDLHADTDATYRELTGSVAFEAVTTNIETILRAQDRRSGAPRPWLVPRILRRDAVYSEIELFFDRWVHYAGAAVIDQSPSPIEGDRIEPLGKPRNAAWRDWRRRMLVLADGCVPADERAREAAAGNACSDPIPEVWARLMTIRERAWCERGPAAAECWTGW